MKAHSRGLFFREVGLSADLLNVVGVASSTEMLALEGSIVHLSSCGQKVKWSVVFLVPKNVEITKVNYDCGSIFSQKIVSWEL